MRRFLLLLLIAPFSAQLFSPLAEAQATLTFQPGTTTVTTSIPNSTPVRDKPYTAHQTMHTERRLPDGTLLTQDFEVTELRDASGLIANLTHKTGSANQSRPSVLELHTVIDPAAHTILEWNNLVHSARLFHLPSQSRLPPAGLLTPPAPEQLGHRILAGHTVTGTRYEAQIPGAAVGSATPLRSTTVAWRSDALDAILESTITNPGNGTTTVKLVDLHEGPVDPALFHIPAGYTLRDYPLHGAPDTLPPAIAAAALPLPSLSYSEAMDALDNIDQDRAQATIAAAVLVKLCMPASAAAAAGPTLAPLSVEERDKAAYTMARHGLQLVTAEAIAQRDVQQAEQTVAAGAPAAPNLNGSAAGNQSDLPSKSSLHAQHALARTWDTYGYILNRNGKDGAHYLLAAWTLDPLAYYGSHLGQAYEAAHMTGDAVAVYRQALKQPGGAQMKQAIAARLQALAGPVDEASGNESTSAAASPQASPASSIPPNQAAPARTAQAVALIAYAAGQPPQGHVVTRVPGTVEGATLLAALNHTTNSWSLPDAGPEHITRLISIECTPSGPCTTSSLPLLSPLPRF
jgi:hypothetical protein